MLALCAGEFQNAVSRVATSGPSPTFSPTVCQLATCEGRFGLCERRLAAAMWLAQPCATVFRSVRMVRAGRPWLTRSAFMRARYAEASDVTACAGAASAIAPPTEVTPRVEATARRVRSARRREGEPVGTAQAPFDVGAGAHAASELAVHRATSTSAGRLTRRSPCGAESRAFAARAHARCACSVSGRPSGWDTYAFVTQGEFLESKSPFSPIVRLSGPAVLAHRGRIV